MSESLFSIENTPKAPKAKLLSKPQHTSPSIQSPVRSPVPKHEDSRSMPKHEEKENAIPQTPRLALHGSLSTIHEAANAIQQVSQEMSEFVPHETVRSEIHQVQQFLDKHESLAAVNDAVEKKLHQLTKESSDLDNTMKKLHDRVDKIMAQVERSKKLTQEFYNYKARFD